MRKINSRAIWMGIKAGMISSSCCILPLILVFLGVVSIGSALKLVQYKPYFIILGVAFLTASLILYFKKNKTCHAENKKFFMGTAIITHILVFVALLYVFVPVVAPFVYTDSSIKIISTDSENNKLTLRILTLKINGMTCSGCASGIQYQLEQLDGVIESEVSFLSGTAEVTYNPEKISKEEIINSEAFADFYSAEIIREELADRQTRNAQT